MLAHRAGGGVAVSRHQRGEDRMVLAIAPILVVFLFSQRALVSGMLAGATKE